MNARNSVVLSLFVAVFSAVAWGHAQVIVRGTDSSDNSTTHSEVNVSTMDRTVVPLVKDVQKTKPDASTDVTETVTRARLNDGTYYDWQRTSTVEKQVAPDTTETSNVEIVKDRQGRDRVVSSTTQNVVKSDEGEQSQVKVYTRNSSGQLTLDRQTDVSTVNKANGQADTTRIEKVTDINGNVIVRQQNEETTVAASPNEKVTTALTRSVDHLTGRIGTTSQAETTERTVNDTKQIDTVVRTPGRMGWEVTGQTTTTEQTGPDGKVTRETVEKSRSLYSVRTGDQMMEPLVPQRKVVEQEVRTPDGSVAVQREVFRRDVNGEWRHESFSTDQPNAPVGQRPPAPKDTQPVAPPPPAKPPMEIR